MFELFETSWCFLSITIFTSGGLNAKTCEVGLLNLSMTGAGTIKEHDNHGEIYVMCS